MDNNLNEYSGGNGSNNQNGNRPGGNNNQGGNGQQPKKQNLLILLVTALISLLIMSYFMRMVSGGTEQEISYNQFLTMVEEGKIESVELAVDRINITPVKEEESTTPLAMSQPLITYYTGLVEDDT